MVCEHRCAVICCRQTGISKTCFCCLFLDFPVRDCFKVKMGLKHRDFHRTKIRVVTMMRASICCCLFAFFLRCNITAGIKHEIIRNKESVTLRCPPSVEGKVTWSRENRGRIVDILTADGNRETRHINDTRFTASADQRLIILRPAASDSGAYLCNNQPAVQLTVISPGQSASTRFPANATSAPPTNSDQQLLLGLIYGAAASFICIIIIIIIVASVFYPARSESNKQAPSQIIRTTG